MFADLRSYGIFFLLLRPGFEFASGLIVNNDKMKNQTLPFLFKIFFAAAISLLATSYAIAYPSGAPAGYTGSPGDGHHCVSCHNGSSATVNNWITSDIPAEGYTPGTVYNLTVTVTGSGAKGFEVSPQNPTGLQLGTLAAGSGSKLVGGTKYVTQSSSSSAATKIWNFTWTAPAAGTGVVTFYGAFTVNKPVTKLSTLQVSENTATPLSATATATPPVICSGQSSQLNVVPAGGSGTYTYSWTSVPAGFASTLQNPVVAPNMTTQYTVTVSDGTGSVDAFTSVTVNLPATANAGNDTTCAYLTTQVPLSGIATNYSGVMWTTSGTGTFSSPNAPSGYYYPSLTDKNLGSVTLTLTASPQSPCTATATDDRVVHFEGPIGIPDKQNSLYPIVLFPNPSKGMFSLSFNGVGNAVMTITISDITGRTIIQRTVSGSSGQPEQFNMTGNPKGLYFVKIRTSLESTVQRLVID